MAADTTDLAAIPARVRHRFPLLERRTYVNSCSQGALSDAVRGAYEAYLRDWDERGSPWELWVERVEAVRGQVAALLNASTDEIAVTASVSAGVSALTSALAFDGERDGIVMTDLEFPTIGQIMHAQERRGARVARVAAEGPTGAEIALDAISRLVDERTALVAITHVSYRTGTRLPVAEIVRIAHDRGARVLLDSYQAAGALDVDVRALDVDFCTGGMLKYLLSSAGIGFLYARADHLGALFPTATGWFADEDIFSMDHTDYSPHRTARRLEGGTPPVPSAYAAEAGIALAREMGPHAVEAHVAALIAHLSAGVEDLGAHVVTPADPAQRGPMLAIRSTDQHALVAALDAEAIITSCRDGNLRMSLHGYNTLDDVDTLLAGLARHRGLLGTR